MSKNKLFNNVSRGTSPCILDLFTLVFIINCLSASTRGILVCSNQRISIVLYIFLCILSLISYIIFDLTLITISSNGTNETASTSNVTSPQFFLNLRI